MSVSKRGKRSGNPHIAFRLDRDLAEYLKAQPEGVRAYLSRLISTDKDSKDNAAIRQEALRQMFEGFTDSEGRYNGGPNRDEH